MEIIKQESNELLTQEVSQEYLELEEQIKALKERQESIKEHLLEAMVKDNVVSLENDAVKVTLIEATYSERFDSKKFKKDHEELYNDYIQISPRKAYLKITKK